MNARRIITFLLLLVFSHQLLAAGFLSCGEFSRMSTAPLMDSMDHSQHAGMSMQKDDNSAASTCCDHASDCSMDYCSSPVANIHLTVLTPPSGTVASIPFQPFALIFVVPALLNQPPISA